jgi:hypothetical protein
VIVEGFVEECRRSNNWNFRCMGQSAGSNLRARPCLKLEYHGSTTTRTRDYGKSAEPPEIIVAINWQIGGVQRSYSVKDRSKTKVKRIWLG